MRIGVIPPIPIEVFTASPHEVINLWSAFFLETDRGPLLETARMAGFPDNFSHCARSIYGLVCDLDIKSVFYPHPGIPKELTHALQQLGEHDVEVVPFAFPLLRNEERLRGEIDGLCIRLGVDPGVLSMVMEQWQQVRTVLRRFDGLQQRTGAFSSQDYVTMLAKSMDPRGDLEELRKTIERGILDYKDLGRDRWTRIGILGLPPWREGFYDILEKNRAVVVYDEWGVENNPMSASFDLAHVYHMSSLPYGLKRRQERIMKEAAARKIRGFVLGVEYIRDSLRDEGFFRNALGLPVFTIENRGGGGLSSAEAGGLERFLAQLGS
jgi:hypothetical protein